MAIVSNTLTDDAAEHEESCLVASLPGDAQGNPHVSYYDNTTFDLKYARRSGTAWTTEFADASANDVGFYTSLALDAQGNPHVSYRDVTTGDLKYADAAVHVFVPGNGVTWAVGSLQNIRWTGIGPVDVFISLDGGGTFDLLRTGLVDNVFPLRVPHVPTRFARLRVERSSAESNVFTAIHAGLLDGEEYEDSDQGEASRYRLTAVNGLGEEYILGETAIASPLPAGRMLTVAPNPALSGKTRVLFRVPADLVSAELAIYDASGQLVRTLLAESQAAGSGVLDWDGRDARDRPVAAGVYFIRLSSMGGFAVTERVTVVR